MSAFIISQKEYIKLINCLRSIRDLQHTNGSYSFLLNPIKAYLRKPYYLSDDYLIEFVVDLIKMNYRSVNFRYKENNIPDPVSFSPEPVEMSPCLLYQIAYFLKCWDCQSCEIDDPQLTGREKKLFKTVEELIKNCCDSALEILYKEKATWGEINL